jgi:lipoyl(octanoyl) transferase
LELSDAKTSETNIIPSWKFIDSGFQTGRFNMDFDLELVERCRKEGTFFFRVYRWKPYSISLGYNQQKQISKQRIDEEKCARDGMDVVQRPTGGRAVLHSEELTYSVVMKSDKSVHSLYKDISIVLLNGLKLIEPDSEELNKLSFTKDNPDLQNLAKTGMYNLCFNTSIKYEINYNGRKLVGSAQRNFGDVVLQHGSILLGEHHKNIVNYLNLEDKRMIEKLKYEIDKKTACLNEILGREVSYEETSEALIKGFEQTYGITLT